MFAEIVLINFRRSLAARRDARKFCGPYHWTPAKPGAGRGFYQASNGGLRIDQAGSSFALRLEWANDLLPRGSRLGLINGYYCDEFQDCTMVPIVARLPRSRGFLAGWTMGAGMYASLDATIWEIAEDAARAAHDMAERDAEREREYQERERERFEAEEREQKAEEQEGADALCD